jgi:small subunit ribosomal protein S9
MAESIMTDNIEKAAPTDVISGTGKRKCAIARVWLKPGDGKITVNGVEPSKHFTRAAQVARALLPLKVAERENRYDILIRVHGGGVAGHSDAVRLGIARALEKKEPDLRGVLKKAGCLTRDSRIKERKKYGQKGARKKFQFSKR